MQLTQKNLIASQAWEIIKAPGDPSWAQCHSAHKDKLIAQLEALLNTGGASNPFEKECKKILEGLEIDAAKERALAESAASDTGVLAAEGEPVPLTDAEVDPPAPSKRKRGPKKPSVKPAKAAKKKR